MLLSQAPWVIGASQMIACVAGAALGPGMVGLTLGVARQEGFNAQQGRNQAFNHAGNLAGAALSGVLGWRFGFAAVFWLATLFSALSIGCVFAIPKRGHRRCRGARSLRCAAASRIGRAAGRSSSSCGRCWWRQRR